MRNEAVVAIEMDNPYRSNMKVNTANCYFEKTSDGKIAYVVNMFNANRNNFCTYYILKRNSSIAKEISQTQEFIKTGYFKEEHSLQDIEKETTEIRQGLTTHWFTTEELGNLFETGGFKEIEIMGDGLLMNLLLEGNETIVESMKKQPELFFEIEKRLIPLIDPNKAATFIIKGSKK